MKNLNIVGFCYKVTTKNSQASWITNRLIGRETSNCQEIAGGYNWSSTYQEGYGHSIAFFDPQGPFIAITGGFTEYTNQSSSSRLNKDHQWGVPASNCYCLAEGYVWNHFLNNFGYARSYIYYELSEETSNICSFSIKATSQNSQAPWINTQKVGDLGAKQVKWGNFYGWSEQYKEGYLHFFLEPEELDLQQAQQKKDLQAKLLQLEQELVNTKVQLELSQQCIQEQKETILLLSDEYTEYSE